MNEPSQIEKCNRVVKLRATERQKSAWINAANGNFSSWAKRQLDKAARTPQVVATQNTLPHSVSLV